jgi:uncharacterized protein involved in oxidation of intracellular sulfur
MKVLIILNEPPYGNERSYNGLRLAGSLARQSDVQVRLFLIGDAVSCGKKGQKVPQGYYNVQSMIALLVRHASPIGACGTCMDARGITEPELIEGVHRGSMEELTAWTMEADKVISF